LELNKKVTPGSGDLSPQAQGVLSMNVCSACKVEKPVRAFTDLTDREQLLELCNYRNLQPLWWDENIKKGSWYNGKKHSKKEGL
jgi:hypothetical protein